MLPGMAPAIFSRANSFPNVVQSLTDNETFDNDSHEIALPANVSGDLLVVGITVKGFTNHSINTPANWTQIAQPTTGTDDDDVRCGVFRRTSPGSLASVTFTFSGDIEFLSVAYAIQGWDAVTGVGVIGTGVQPDPPLLSPAYGNKKMVWLPFVAWRASDDIGPPALPANYTDLRGIRYTGGIGSKRGIYSARRYLRASSENPGAFTLSGTPSNMAAVTVAVLGA